MLPQILSKLQVRGVGHDPVVLDRILACQFDRISQYPAKGKGIKPKMQMNIAM